MADLFLSPAMLHALWLAPIVWLGLGALDRARARRVARVLGARAPRLAKDVDARVREARRLLFAFAFAFAVVALAQPAWGVGERSVEQRGVDLVVCLDVSRSMLARDAVPSRLGRAKRAIEELALQTEGDRLALVLFAGAARLAVPLTRDADTFAQLVDTADPLAVAAGGTDLGAALQGALEALGEEPDGATILLLTDGEDPGQRGLAVARECVRLGVTVHCVGFGTVRGSKIVVDVEGEETFLQDRTGSDVVSAMDPEGLRAIAEATGGVFVDAGSSRNPLLLIRDEHVRSAALRRFEAELRSERLNRYALPLLVAFLLFVVESALAGRRRG